MSDRALATIQKITAIDPIEGADNIERASIEGWHIVVKRGEFKVGDLCIYVEIDSILPAWPEFDFMAKRHYKVRTIKLRKQISQGIIFPLSILPQTPECRKLIEPYKKTGLPVGLDVTEVMQIKKNEPDVNNQTPVFLKKERSFYARIIKPVVYNWAYGIRKNPSLGASFPSFIPKTDETRVQWMMPVLNKFRGERFFITEKCEGSSMTVYFHEEHYGVCSRNLEILSYEKKEYIGLRKVWSEFIAKVFNLREPLPTKDNNFLNMSKKLGIKKSLMLSFPDLAIQGELIGPGIQKNIYNLKEHEFRVFNVFLIKDRRYMNLEEMKDTCSHLGLSMVPVIDDNFILGHSIDEIVELSKGNSTLFKTKREGIVLRLYNDCNAGNCGMISMKAINPEYLLSHDE